jgi:hypothetical protein
LVSFFIIYRKKEGDESIITDNKRNKNEFEKIRTVKYLDFHYSSIYKNKIKDNKFQLKEFYNFNKLSNHWESFKSTQSLIQENKRNFCKINYN